MRITASDRDMRAEEEQRIVAQPRESRAQRRHEEAQPGHRGQRCADQAGAPARQTKAFPFHGDPILAAGRIIQKFNFNPTVNVRWRGSSGAILSGLSR
jgi:hypothetical protein